MGCARRRQPLRRVTVYVARMQLNPQSQISCLAITPALRHNFMLSLTPRLYCSTAATVIAARFATRDATAIQFGPFRFNDPPRDVEQNARCAARRESRVLLY